MDHYELLQNGKGKQEVYIVYGKNTAFLSISVKEEIIKELRKIKSSFCYERFQI